MPNPPLKPVFIVGVGRSGTTLLVNLLGQHPLLAPIYETPFLRKVIRHCDRTLGFWQRRKLSRLETIIPPWVIHLKLKSRSNRVRKSIVATLDGLSNPSTIKQEYETFPFGLVHCILFTPEELTRETDAWLKQLQAGPLSEEEIYRLAREYIDRLFAIHCARLNKPYWVNKTPALLNYLDKIPKLYPSAKCIHVLRDGRDCATSMISLPWGPRDIGEAARHWKEHLLSGRRKLNSHPLKYMELRYEDLIETPRDSLSKVFDFIGITADPDTMMSAMTLYNTRVQTWKTVFTPSDRRAFAREAGDLLIELGYEKDRSWCA